MKLFFLLLFLFFPKVESFLYLQNNRLPIKLYVHNPKIHVFIIKKKTDAVLKLIRANNIPATTFLCFSGGFIMNPHFFSLFQNKYFWISTLLTNLIMSASMVINDIFDMEVDRINSPERPLITGEVSKKEAIGYTVGLLGLTEVLSMRYLPLFSQMIIHSATLFTLIYTPLLKRILFLKNLSCATIVAFSLFFTGVSSTNIPLSIHPNREILMIACNTIFSGSLMNELILDIRDYTGDKMYNISTVSTCFGKDVGYKMTNVILYLNIFRNMVVLDKIVKWKIGILYCLLFFPQAIFLKKIGEKREYSKIAIQKYMSQTNTTLVCLFIYLYFLSNRI